MTTYDEALARAREIGREHGENAATDWFDTIVSYRPALLLDQMNGGGSWADGNGGPDTNPILPGPDLSGEWADGYTPRQLLRDCGGNDGDASFWDGLVSNLCDAYEMAFSEAVKTAVRAACESALSE